MYCKRLNMKRFKELNLYSVTFILAILLSRIEWWKRLYDLLVWYKVFVLEYGITRLIIITMITDGSSGNSNFLFGSRTIPLKDFNFSLQLVVLKTPRGKLFLLNGNFFRKIMKCLSYSSITKENDICNDVSVKVM